MNPLASFELDYNSGLPVWIHGEEPHRVPHRLRRVQSGRPASHGGARWPSTSISATTPVNRAYMDLEREGYISTRKGRGTFVAERHAVGAALAADNPDATVVFLGVGFETTAPAVAATVLAAEQRKLDNFAVFSCHKLVPPALAALLGDPDNGIDAFLLPGHVSTVLGLSPFRFVAEDWKRPAIVAGFEPADILDALCRMARQYREGEFKVENAYPRAVNDDGNPKARAILSQVFRTADALWRGLGVIPGSGLALAPAYQRFDALARLGLSLPETKPLPGCRCGEVLKGKMPPNECPLFGAGVSYGYAFSFSPSWGMELNIGGGYAQTRYRLYSNVPNGAWLDTRTLRYWGLTRLGVSFIYKLPQP